MRNGTYDGRTDMRTIIHNSQFLYQISGSERVETVQLFTGERKESRQKLNKCLQRQEFRGLQNEIVQRKFHSLVDK